jgi:hypothetical protein
MTIEHVDSLFPPEKDFMLAFPLKEWKIYVTREGKVVLEVVHATPFAGPHENSQQKILFDLTNEQARMLGIRMVTCSHVGKELENQARQKE